MREGIKWCDGEICAGRAGDIFLSQVPELVVSQSYRIVLGGSFRD